MKELAALYKKPKRVEVNINFYNDKQQSIDAYFQKLNIEWFLISENGFVIHGYDESNNRIKIDVSKE